MKKVCDERTNFFKMEQINTRTRSSVIKFGEDELKT